MYSLGNSVTGAINGNPAYPFFDVGAFVGTREAMEAYQSRHRALNAASNLCVCQLEIVVMNGQGSIKYLSDKAPFQRSIDDLYRFHRKNCNKEYMRGMSQTDWENRFSCVLLTSDQIQLGITSPAVHSPLSLSVRCWVENRCRFQCGSQFGAQPTSCYPMTHSAPQATEPCLVMIYDNGYTVVSEGSAISNGFLISKASLDEAFERNAQENPL
jgi:hypothetical protein